MASSLFDSAHGERVAVLSVDRELAERLDGARRTRAEALSVTRMLRRPTGVWNAKDDARHGRDGAGLLVVEGVLVRRVGMAGRYGAELLSAGGVKLDVRLTHELIGHLVGAHRPSVSAALGRLEERGQLRRQGRSWLLVGMPASIDELKAAAGDLPG
jgi:CRP-like cAMP-binding protein